MAKEISYKNDNEPLKNETCEMSHFPENYDEAVTIINNATGLSHSDLISEIKLYNTKLTSLKNTRSIITGSKYAKDNLLFSVIKNTNAPKYLKHEIFNYKALVLYFMRSFKNSKKILIKHLDNSKMSEMSLRDLNRKYFQNNDFININTHLDTYIQVISATFKKVRIKG